MAATPGMNFGPEGGNAVATPRDAATVLLLRDAPGGFEVFMVKRSGLSDVLGEAHVFPGGKIDQADSDVAMLERLRALGALNVAALGEDLPPPRAAGMYVAALRETFEEAGVLIGADEVAADVLAAARARLNAKESFAAILAECAMTIDASSLVPWVRWVTPVMLAKRFDARFFLARAPEGQLAMHDNYEATHSEWLKPARAIERWRDGSVKLAPPTFMSLQHLALFDSIDDALADARSRLPPILQPEPFDDGGVRCLALPGDARHPVRAAAIPGPTFLRWDGVRYAPA